MWILWVKAFHVISIIAWMAGMLYLPRLFVYHADAEKGSVQSETFKVMERRLYRGITTPAMIASYVFGLIMIFYGLVDWHAIWPWVKAVFVIALSGVHGLWGSYLRAFAKDENQKSGRFFRSINEIPMVFAIVIVIMVVVQPF
ncbi:MAG: protoporphyrinogen oxidase HemJ [Devosia sp.]|nr:protoporphyrinogen oxidase HemJ [Devosia sp.]